MKEISKVVLFLILSFTSFFCHSMRRYEENDTIIISITEHDELGVIIPLYVEVKLIDNNTFPARFIKDEMSIDLKRLGMDIEWPLDAPDSISIPEGIEDIYPQAFQNYPKLQSACFPNSLKRISEGAFKNKDLLNVSLPPSLREIMSKTFEGNECLRNINLGNVSFIGPKSFKSCSVLSWIEIPKETRIIGLESFADCPLFFLRFPATDLNPVVEFERTFGKTDIPFIACPSEILNPGIEATYQTDMPEVFKDRAMIHLEDTSIPVYFSFEPTGVREGRWEPDVDMWPLLEKEERTKEEDNDTATDSDSKGYGAFKYPIEVRIDTSSLKKKQRRRISVLYNGTDITDSVKDGRFALESGYPYEMKDGKYMFNTLKIVIDK